MTLSTSCGVDQDFIDMKERKEPILAFTAVAEIEAHMSSPSADAKGFWLKLAKAGALERTISKEEAIEAALCCGWIDGQLDRFDEHYFLVRMTPRRSSSRWSAKNCATAERLAQAGRLKAAGLAEIEAAKRDGRWDAAYQSSRTAEMPDDLTAALASNRAAKRFFETLDSANRFAIIYRVNDAKRAETRAKRVAQYVEMCARGETIHPARKARKTAAKAH
jgi:uncharacterized protein YdeI (YjbR/CyaY-like superfamily)